MEYNSKSLTREGATMLALADKEEKALIIDEVIVSEKVITAGTDISALTMADFANPLTYGISSKVQSDNQFSVKSVITNHWQDSANTDHTTNKDFNVALVGVVAHVDSFADQHVLTVAVGNDPFVLPAYQGTDVSFVFGITQAYSASQNVTIKMDGSAYALATDLDDIKNLQGSIGIAIDSKLADYVKTDDVEKLIPATVIDGSKPADFKESVTLEKGAVDGAGNAIATSKNLADGDAKTLTSAKEYADTQASGKADDSKVVHKTGDEEISGSKTFDTAPVDKTTGNPYITVTDLNNGLSTKVTDNKDGTEQLNGVQVQPFNKLSDTIGGRNLIVAKTIEKSAALDSSGNPTGYSPSFLTDHIPVVANQKYTITIYGTTISCISRIAYYDSSKNFVSRENDVTISTGSSEVVLIPSGASYIRFSPNTPDQSGEYKDNFKIEKGSIATDWTPAPEDKVNVSDMRKPASDVAGIEEVNAKQDKLDYTPANNANVVHRNPDTGVVSEPVDFTKLTVNGGKSVATSDDLKSLEASAWKLLVNSDATTAFYRLVDGTLYISGYARVGGNGGNTYASLTIVSQLPTELQNKVWTIQKKMTVGLNSGDYAMTADLSFGKDSSLSATSSVPNGWTHDGIVIFNNSYTQS